MFHTLDPFVLVFAIPGLILSMLATMYVKPCQVFLSQIRLRHDGA